MKRTPIRSRPDLDAALATALKQEDLIDAQLALLRRRVSKVRELLV